MSLIPWERAIPGSVAFRIQNEIELSHIGFMRQKNKITPLANYFLLMSIDIDL